MWPPWVDLAPYRQGQHTGRSLPICNCADHLIRRIASRLRRVTAIMVSCEIPKPWPIGGGEYGDRKRGLQPHGRSQHLPPHANEVCDGEGAVVASDKAADDLGFAGGLKCRLVSAFLVGCNHRHDFRPVDKEVLQLVVDLV